MKEIISMTSAARIKGKIKRRWPLHDIQIYLKHDHKKLLKNVEKLLITQLNVKHCKIIEINNDYDIITFKKILELKSLNAPIKPIIKLNIKKNSSKIQKKTYMQYQILLQIQIQIKLLIHSKIKTRLDITIMKML